MHPLVLLPFLFAAVLAEQNLCGDLVLIPTVNGTGYQCYTVEEIRTKQISSRFFFFNPKSQIEFYLWTSASRPSERLKLGDRESLRQSSFNVSNPTRFLVHGWLGSWTSRVVKDLSDAYLQKGEFNVIGVDWSAGASSMSYIVAQSRVTAVGKVIAQQINLLLEVGQSPAQITVIGHSLGGHIAGIAGKHSNERIAAVISLDPAGPLFSYGITSNRIHAGDAQYVEVIHTNAGTLGHYRHLGQADFYPNGGFNQPGCVLCTCSHQRAVDYFIQSIADKVSHYYANKCGDKSIDRSCTSKLVVMAGDPDDANKVHKPENGIYYLTIDAV